MTVTHLPREAVQFINALERASRGRAVGLEEARAAFAELREHARRWVHFHGGFTLHDREAAVLANIACLWDQIDLALDASGLPQILEGLVPALYQAVQAMDEVLAERQRPHFSLQPVVNDFVMAGLAIVLGRGEWRAIEERLPVVERYLANLTSLYEGASPRLLAEVAEELQHGLCAMREGLVAAGASVELQDVQKLREGVLRLQAGSVLLQHFLDWERRDDERLAETCHRFQIPLGPTFEHCLTTARRISRAHWGRALGRIEAVLIPRLEAFWAHARERVLLPAELRQARIDAVHTALGRLREAVKALPDPNIRRSEALDIVEEALTSLSAAFEDVRHDAFKRDALRGTEADTWYELIGGVLSGTVPDLAVGRALMVMPELGARSAALERVRAYLNGYREEDLLAALSILVEPSPSSEQPAEGTWTCSCCGEANKPGDHACRRCSTRPEALVTTSWEA